MTRMEWLGFFVLAALPVMPGLHGMALERALGEALCAAVLCAWVLLRRIPLPSPRAWAGVFALFIASMAFLQFQIAGEDFPTGTRQMIRLASPVLLFFFASLGVVRRGVPRLAVAAGILSMALVMLTEPTAAYAVSWRFLPWLGVHVLLGLVAVALWIFARPRVQGTPVAMLAAMSSLISTIECFVVLARLRSAMGTLGPRPELLIVAQYAALFGAGVLLTYWIFTRLPLYRFSLLTMGTLQVQFAVALIFGLVETIQIGGAPEWRVVIAAAGGTWMLIAALRARADDDEPLGIFSQQDTQAAELH